MWKFSSFKLFNSDLKIEGLSTLHYKIDQVGLLLAYYFNMSVANVIGTAGDYFAAGYIDAHPFSQETIPSGNFTGSGAGTFSATNIKLNGFVNFFVAVIDNKVSLYSLRLDVASFDSLNVDLGPDFIIAGSPVDWNALSAAIKDNFDREFAGNKEEIVERIRKAVSSSLNVSDDVSIRVTVSTKLVTYFNMNGF